MRGWILRYGTALICLTVAIWMWLPAPRPAGGQDDDLPAVVGFLFNEQRQPVTDATVAIFLDGEEQPTVETESFENGLWELELPRLPEHSLQIEAQHHHYKTWIYTLDINDTALENQERIQALMSGQSVNLGTVQLDNDYTLGFWVTAGTFLLVLLLIIFERMANTTAALLGTAIVFASTFLGSKVVPELYIFDFERALTYINWEVIFLVLGMMIVISVIESTGLFQWLAFMSYRWSRGSPVLLVIVLVIITSLASALLDNVTTMLLMVPITLEVAVAVGLPPTALLIIEIMASNIGGTSTLIGTPSNILVGVYADLSFNDFLVDLTLGVLLALITMTAFVLWYYRKEFSQGKKGISPRLYAKLAENATIKDVTVLRKSLAVFAVTIAAFAAGETLNMVPAVTALLSATVMLVWVETDVERMLSLVDWTTLVFFMALFMLVGAVQEVGLMGTVASAMGELIGTSVLMGVLVVVFGFGLLSFFVATIPLTASMLPVVDYLSGNLGLSSKVLYYGLAIGTSFGGNALLIGGETNLMTAGVTERAGYRISFKRFAQVGLPVTLLSLLVGCIWLLVRFEVLGG
ncbi:SLC13 family permease [Aggregatilinea lenta]|uniref:SLC13 family permease n=1 Tax=Aggregatilinea lenta TaxID=913108 RepID=UPI000E5C2652|nr:ArsB/NhaD family transporter [Aggregatilinea lenta]